MRTIQAINPATHSQHTALLTGGRQATPRSTAYLFHHNDRSTARNPSAPRPACSAHRNHPHCRLPFQTMCCWSSASSSCFCDFYYLCRLYGCYYIKESPLLAPLHLSLSFRLLLRGLPRGPPSLPLLDSLSCRVSVSGCCLLSTFIFMITFVCEGYLLYLLLLFD